MTRLLPTSETERTPLIRPECYLVLLLVLLGIGLRVAALQSASVEHFDEGVYASKSWFSVDKRGEGGTYPDQHLYAPELLPLMVEQSIELIGPAGLGVMLFPLLFGVLTLPLFWWVARSWFGRSAGLIALACISLSDVHILYSRTVLTDVPLAFCVLLAVYLWNRSIQKESWGDAILAGVALSLGWGIKYNGWLPIAIVLAGMIPWWWFNRKGTAKESSVRLGISFLVMSVIGVLLWSPWSIFFSLENGYAEVAENHRQYVTGLSHWFHSGWRQVVNHQVLNSWVGCLSLALGWVMAAGLVIGTRNESVGKRSWGLLGCGFVMFFALGVAFNPVVFSVVVTACLLLTAMWREFKADQTSASIRMSRESWLLSAWFFGLLLATPMYHPYPRLTLPLMLAAWLGFAALLGRVIDVVFAEESCFLDDWPKWTVPAICVGSVIDAGIALIIGWANLSPVAWEDRTAFDTMSNKILRFCERETAGFERPMGVHIDFVLYVYAEPGLYFHLKKEYPAVGPAGSLAHLDGKAGIGTKHPVPTYYILGPHAQRMLKDDPQWEERRNQLQEVKRFPYLPSTFIRLNEPDWSRASDDETESVILYRLRD